MEGNTDKGKKMNVLIISLAYAPYSGVGSARMISLSKYLVEQGCKVTVVCYDSRVFGEKEQRGEVPRGVERVIVEKKEGKIKNIRNLEQFVEMAVKEKDFQVCIVSVGPYEPMFFIDKIWRKWGIPYVIDYRDTWLFDKNTIKPKGIVKYKALVYEYLCLPIEKRATKYAKKIVQVTDKCKDDIVERYHLKNEKCEVIYNGYEDVPAKYPPKEKSEFTIGIAGKFSYYNPDAAEMLLTVCEEMSSVCPVKIIHVGEKDALSEKRHPKVYVNVGIKTHRETMEILAGTDACLICYGYGYGYGTKVFDYIALNKPVLYVGLVPSELTGFLGRFEYSYACQNKDEIQAAIKELVQKRPAYLTTKDVGKYSREFQNERYWELIRGVKN